jgi:LPS sulfotransferase NodH
MAVSFPRITDNPHQHAIEQHFGAITVPPDAIPRDTHFIFLCFTNRCGSNHLADAMHSDGRLNMAGEFFNADAVLDDVKLHGHPTSAEYIRLQMLWRQRSHRFVVKIAIPHLVLLGRAGVLDAVDARSHYIFLTRDDRLAQAISLAIAQQTHQWVAGDPLPPPDALAYSRAHIDRLMAEIADANLLFERFFARNVIEPIRLTYEAFLADRHRGLAQIGAAIGLPDLRLVLEALTIERQPSAVKAAWRARYLAGA